MSDFDPGTDEHGVPLRYSAEWHQPGCLPETDVLLWATPREAWNDLIDRLQDYEGMWVGEEKSNLHRDLEAHAASNQPGQVADTDGYLYSVEDTHVVFCGTCGRSFPDLYPAGRCPYETSHEEVVSGV